MKIRSLEIQNIKSFKDSHTIEFSTRLNIFIGRNNSGKSTILNSILNLQRELYKAKDITLGETFGSITLNFDRAVVNLNDQRVTSFKRELTRPGNVWIKYFVDGDGYREGPLMPSNEPYNYIYISRTDGTKKILLNLQSTILNDTILICLKPILKI